MARSDGSDLVTRSGHVAAVEGELEMNRDINTNTVAYDEDVVDEWGWIQAAVKDQIVPPSPMALKTDYYGWVVATVKSTLECEDNATPVPGREAPGLGNQIGSLFGFDEDDALETIGQDTGYVRVRIPELSVLPVIPAIPDVEVGVRDPSYCRRVSNQFEKDTLAIARMYPLFSYLPDLENQNGLKIGAMVKVRLYEPKAPLRRHTPTTSIPHGKPMPHFGGVLEGDVIEVIMKNSRQPMILPAIEHANTGDAGGPCTDFDFGILAGPTSAASRVPGFASTSVALVAPQVISYIDDDIEILARVMTKERGEPWYRRTATAPGIWSPPAVADLPYDTTAQNSDSKEYLLGEWVGIAYVVINRANTEGMRLSDETIYGGIGGLLTNYKDKIRPPGHATIAASSAAFWSGARGGSTTQARMRKFAKSILDGEYMNPIGARNYFLHPTNYGYLHNNLPLTPTSPVPAALGQNPWPANILGGPQRSRYTIDATTGYNKVSKLTGLGSYAPPAQYEIKWEPNTSMPLAPIIGGSHPGSPTVHVTPRVLTAATRVYIHGPGGSHDDPRYSISDARAFAEAPPVTTPAQLRAALAYEYYVRLPLWSVASFRLLPMDPSLVSPDGTAYTGHGVVAYNRIPTSAGIAMGSRPMHIGLARFSHAPY